jgi:hypothetical protein
MNYATKKKSESAPPKPRILLHTNPELVHLSLVAWLASGQIFEAKLKL